MYKKKIAILLAASLSVSLLTGFGLKDLKKEVLPDTEKCEKKKDKSKCKNKERAKSAVKIVAIGVAAKLIYDMVVEYTSLNVKGDHEIIEIYLKDHDELPKEPTVIAYEASLSPSNVAKVGKEISVKTSMSVVPGKKIRETLIEEKIQIFDNEDDSKVIKEMVKSVNKNTKAAGAYDNQFTFTLPKGMPQGIYPIKTAVIVGGKEQPAKQNKMQVVLHVFENSSYQIAYLQ